MTTRHMGAAILDGMWRGWVVVLCSLVVDFVILAVYNASPTNAKRLPPIYWNETNPIFRVDNTDHVKDVTIGDSVDIVCPHYSPSTKLTHIPHYLVYQVTREEYETCRVSHLDRDVTRRILDCDRPYDIPSKVFRMVFREYTPVPNGLEYRTGHDYFYISVTAPPGQSKSIVEANKDGGSCSEHHMKMILKVCPCEAADSPELSEGAQRGEVSSSEKTARRNRRRKHRHGNVANRSRRKGRRKWRTSTSAPNDTQSTVEVEDDLSESFPKPELIFYSSASRSALAAHLLLCSHGLVCLLKVKINA